MLKSTKVILITAGVLVGLGLIIAGIALGIAKAKNGFGALSEGASAAANHEQQTTKITESFKSVDIAEVSSDVIVAFTDKSEAYAEYTNGENYTHQIGVSGDTLTIEYKDNRAWYRNWGFYPWFTDIDGDPGRYPVKLYLPKGDYKDLTIVAVSGEVEVSGSDWDEISVTTTSGNIKIEDCSVSKKASAATISGEVSVSDLAGCDADISTTSGDIKLEDCSVADGEFQTISGKVELKKYTAKNTDVDTTSGDIKLDDYTSESTDIDTTSGDINGSLRGTYKVEVDTISGDTDVESSDPNGYKMDISTTSGDVELKSAD